MFREVLFYFGKVQQAKACLGGGGEDLLKVDETQYTWMHAKGNNKGRNQRSPKERHSLMNLGICSTRGGGVMGVCLWNETGMRNWLETYQS